MKKIFFILALFSFSFFFYSCFFGNVDGIYVKSVSKTEYYQYEDFDCSTVKIQIVSNGIPYDGVLTESMVSGFDSSVVTDKQVITISNGSVSDAFTIKIKANPLTSLSCNIGQTRLDYVTGEKFASREITAVCIFSSGLIKNVDNSHLNFSDVFFTPGSPKEQTLYVSLKNSDSQIKDSIKVFYHENYTVTAVFCDALLTYNIDDEFEGNVTVEATDEKAFSFPVQLSQCNVTGFNSSATDDNQTVIVTYKNVSCSVIVKITNLLPDYVLNKYTNPGFITNNMSTWKALNCHDPKLFQDDDGTYYVYSTDTSIGNVHKNGIQVRQSKDLISWTCSNKSALDGNWYAPMLSYVGLNSLNAYTWAPTVLKQNGKYYMLHGVITDNVKNSNSSMKGPSACISLAISDSPTGPFIPASSYDPATYTQSNIVRYQWNRLSVSPFNTSLNLANDSWNYGFGAIDPEFVYDVETGNLMTDSYGDYYIIYGSWKGGIALMTLDNETLKPTLNGQVLNNPADMTNGAYGIKIAGGQGTAYEGAQLIYNSENGYYYLFVSMGDLNEDYRVGVGRSKVITGPYLDANGRNLSSVTGMQGNELYFHNVGNKILGAFEMSGEYGWKAPGGLSIFRNKEGKIILSAHTRTTFFPGYYFYLQNRQMFFTDTDWPLLNMNEYAGEKLKKLKAEKLYGTYKTILTERGQNSSVDANATTSKNITLEENGNVTGVYSGSWQLLDDGYSIKIVLNNLGTFTGYMMRSVNWALKNSSERYTYSFTTMCAASGDVKLGEHFFGNKIQ